MKNSSIFKPAKHPCSVGHCQGTTGAEGFCRATSQGPSHCPSQSWVLLVEHSACPMSKSHTSLSQLPLAHLAGACTFHAWVPEYRLCWYLALVCKHKINESVVCHVYSQMSLLVYSGCWEEKIKSNFFGYSYLAKKKNLFWRKTTLKKEKKKILSMNIALFHQSWCKRKEHFWWLSQSPSMKKSEEL